MTTIADIYEGAEELINKLISKEAINKGHYLTGALQDSLNAEVSTKGKVDIMEGFAVYYAQFVNDGTRPEKASMRQFPFVKEYFIKRGLSDKEAGGAAAATIKVWMKQGMSTKASARFSEDGTRNKVVEDAFQNDNGQINNLVVSGFNKVIEELFQQEKSETI